MHYIIHRGPSKIFISTISIREFYFHEHFAAQYEYDSREAFVFMKVQPMVFIKYLYSHKSQHTKVHCLECHLVRILSFAQREGVFQVLLQHGALLVLLDGLEHGLVDGGLVGLPLLGGLVFLLLRGENVSGLGGLLGLGGLGAAEVVVVDAIRDLDTAHVNVGLGSHQVNLVDPPQGAAVQLHGS